ncbi:MAG: outer membrane beta-barrel protein [Acidobacteria bacterium]|nr:outer membrane beta-barrel protein [Acidobacteriota bacterium]
MRNGGWRVWLWALPVLLYAGPAAAQDERLQVSFATATMAGSGDASLALAASVGYRFRERLLLEGDFTATELPMGGFLERSLAPGEPDGGLFRAGRGPVTGTRVIAGGPMDPRRVSGSGRPIGLVEPFRGRESDAFIGTVGLRYELGLRGSRLQPYVGGGLGLARTATELTLARRIGTGDAESTAESVSRTGMAASAGIGTSFRVFRALSVDVDARYFVLDRGPNLTRVGGGVSYRF